MKGLGFLDTMLGPKCVLCGKRNQGNISEVSWVEEYGHYRSKWKVKGLYYHLLCLRMTLRTPQSYSHARADLALEIVERKKDMIKADRRKRNKVLKLEMIRKSMLKKACDDLDDLEEYCLT